MSRKIIVAPNYLKQKLIDENVNQSILFYSKEEFINIFLYKLEDFNLIKAFNLVSESIEISLSEFVKVITSLPTFYDFTSKYFKIKKLKQIKEILDKNNLLYRDEIDVNFIKKQEIEIHIYNKEYDTDLFKIIELNKIKYRTIEHKNLYKEFPFFHFSSFNDEIPFAINRIKLLLENNIDPSSICVITPDSYLSKFEIVSQLFKLKFKTFNTYLYDIPEVKKFINNFSFKNFNDIVFEKSDSTLLSYAFEKIINYLQNVDFDNNDSEEIKLLLSLYCKKTQVKDNRKFINIVSDITKLSRTYEHIFIIGFNLDLDKVFKDSDYVPSSYKQNCSISSTPVQKTLSHQNLMASFLNEFDIELITFSEKDFDSTCNLSSIVGLKNLFSFIKLGGIEKLNSEEIFTSKAFLQEYYSEKCQNYDRYLNKNDLASKLSKIFDVDYDSYSNRYKMTSKFIQIPKEVEYSYSHIDKFLICPFSYYLSNFVLVDKFTSSVHSKIGELYHKYLENYFSKVKKPDEIDVSKFYIENDNISNFFIDKAYKNIHNNDFRLMEFDTFFNNKDTHYFNEQTFNVKLSTNVKLKGKIDFIVETKDYKLIIDFKTGSEKFNKLYAYNDIKLQLPIYSYLLVNSDSSKKLLGSFIWHIYNEDLPPSPSSFDRIAGFITDRSFLDMKNYKVGEFEFSKLFTFNGLSEKDLIINKTIIEKIPSIIINAYNEIKNNNFEIKWKGSEVNSDLCSYCQFKDICFRNYSNKVEFKPYPEEIQQDE